MIPASWARGFAAAAAAALHSDAGRPGLRMGAAIMSAGKVLAVGFNAVTKTHPGYEMRDGNRMIHAEMAALIKRRHYDVIGNEVMYVYRANIHGAATSKPCDICMRHVAISGIRRIRYYDATGTAQQIKI